MSDGLKIRIDESIELLKKYEQQAIDMNKEGYFLAFSGGKDSIVIKELAKMAGVKYQSYFNMTTVDAPEHLKFIREYYPDVKFLKPELSMFQLIEKKGVPTRIVKYCCKYLKEYSGRGRIVVTGIRREESFSRLNRDEFYQRIPKKHNKYLLNPIINWNFRQVWEFIKDRRLKYPDDYNRGCGRIGCIGCPFAGNKQRQREFYRYPRFYRAYIKAFEKARRNPKLKALHKFKSGQEIMDWWLSNDKMIDFIETQKLIKKIKFEGQINQTILTWPVNIIS